VKRPPVSSRVADLFPGNRYKAPDGRLWEVGARGVRDGEGFLMLLRDGGKTVWLLPRDVEPRA